MMSESKPADLQSQGLQQLYHFKAQYEYDGDSAAFDIAATVSNNFLFPSWTNRYQAPLTKEGQVQTYLNILDSRSLRQNQKTGLIQFVREDGLQIDGMRNIDDQTSDNVFSNYKKQASELIDKWDYFFRIVNDKDSEQNFKILRQLLEDKRSFKTFIIQRIALSTLLKNIGENKEVLVDQFFLIRFDNSPSTRPKSIQDYNFQQNNLVIPYQVDLKPSEVQQHTIVVKVNFSQGPLSHDNKARYYGMLENQNVQLLTIEFVIEDPNYFFTKGLGASAYEQRDASSGKILQRLSCYKEDRYFWIDPVISRNKVTIPYQVGKFQRNRIHPGKHFHLAFQGGGAKGLAYVGAYRAIREMQSKNQGGIPIKSIMGSSAGGIIALAISTGIPEYELQKICYKMNQIPSKDRFEPENKYEPLVEAEDDYGNKLNRQNIINTLCKVLDQYGVVQQKTLKNIIGSIVSTNQFAQAQDKLLEWLSLTSPAMGEILSLEKEVEVKVSTGWFSSEMVRIKRREINWEGLLMHGALMKGEAIHDIAKDCLVKFFFKTKAEIISQNTRNIRNRINEEPQQNQEADLKPFLRNCLDNDQRTEVRADNINSFLNEQLRKSQDLLNLELNVIATQFGQELFKNFIAGLVNRYILLLDSFHRLKKNSKGLILSEANNPKISLELLPLMVAAEEAPTLVEYFKKAYKKDNQGIKSSEEIERRLQEVRLEEVPKERENQERLNEDTSLSYGQLNSLLDCNNLINPDHCNVQRLRNIVENNKITVAEFMARTFRRQLDIIEMRSTLRDLQEGKAENSLEIDRVFFSLEGAETVYQLFELLVEQHNKFPENKAKITKEAWPSVFTEYQTAVKDLKEQVGSINMRQYYRMTRIQLSCTSVDLDNKVLRFFNHITTPLLPVCRSVQMTGSFPVGFKAQKWRKEWGKYHVHLLEKKLEIDITGHEFTDGGLLANFPIKYMDNDLIRKRYFSQKTVNGLTILLGFGLDFMEDGRYEKTDQQRQHQVQQQRKSAIAMAELKNIFGTCFMFTKGVKTVLNTKAQDKPIRWTQIPHELLHEIPLIRFGLKIAEAYPNADRNLNLQAFENKVFKQQLQPEWIQPSQFIQNSSAIGKSILRRFIYQYSQHIQPKDTKERSQRNFRYLEGIDLTQLSQDINQVFAQRMLYKTTQATIVKDAFWKLINSNDRHLISRQDKPLSERQLSLRLIKMFYLHLKMPNNKQAASRYSKIYALMKFLAEDQDFRNRRNSQVKISREEDIKPDMNRINFLNLFDEKSFQEISKHLGFYDFDADLYKQFAQKIQGKIVQQGLITQAYKSFINEKRASTLKELKSFNKYDFSDIELYDLTEDIRRVTQLVYLLIRGRDPNGRLKPRSDLQRLISIVKTINYEELLAQSGADNGGRNSRVQRSSQNITYFEIIQFLKRELRELAGLRTKIFVANSWFRDYLDQYESEGERNQQLSPTNNLITLYFSDLLTQSKSRQVVPGEESKTDFYKWYEDEYNFVQNYKSYDEIQIIMKRAILDSINRAGANEASVISRLIYQIIYSQSAARENLKDLKEIDRFLEFVLEKECTVPGITIQKEQEISRMKLKTFEVLFFEIRRFLKKYPKKSAQMGYNALDYSAALDQRERFVREIEQSINQTIIISPEERGLYRVDQIFRRFRERRSVCDDKAIASIEDNILKLITMDSTRQYLESKLTLVPQKDYNESFINQKSLYDSKDQDQNKELEEKRRSIGIFRAEDEKRLQRLRQLKKIHDSYYSDTKLIFQAIRESILLAYKLTLIDRQESSVLLLEWLQRTYSQIFQSFIRKYEQFAGLELNRISESTLGEAFIVGFKSIKRMASNIYLQVRRLYLEVKQKQIQGFSNLAEKDQIIYSIYHIFTKLIRRKLSVPLFDIDWKTSFNLNSPEYRQNFTNILALQLNKKLNTFDTPLKNLQEYQQLFKQPKNAEEVNNPERIGVHLILEGVEQSNEHFGGLYQNIKDIVNQRLSNVAIKDPKGSKEQEGQFIKMITCSNFHSVFGFLLSMGFSSEFIRAEMYKLKYVALSMEKEVDIQNYFDSYAWAKKTPSSQKELLRYLESEHLQLFDRLQSLKSQDYGNVSLIEEFNDIRQLYKHQKENLMLTYNKILEETAKSMGEINADNLSVDYPLEIAKKFGYQFVSQLNEEEFNYSKKSKQSFHGFRKMAEGFFDIFGTLLSGVVCNTIGSSNCLDVTPQNADTIYKGILVNRLLTTFRLKEYIINKLQEARLSPSITLSEFYEVARRRIFLNFTVLDVNRQRLTFLNKNTSPNMPLWAAIVATSSLPFLHNFFEANKEWEASGIKNFHEFFIFDFFKAEPDEDTRVTRYTSGNFISSLPLQLLTNNTIQQRIVDPQIDSELMNLIEFAFCFNPSFLNLRISNTTVQKRYLNFSLGDMGKIIGDKAFQGISSAGKWIKNKFVSKGPHENNNYKIQYRKLSYLSAWLNSGTLLTTFNTLSNSNDNLILKWYYNKLIRLPIKINTLEFNEIVDLAILQSFKTNVLSEKAAETVERSYEITNFFIHRVDARQKLDFSNKPIKQLPSQPNQEISEQVKKIAQNIFKTTVDDMMERFKVKMRVQIIQKTHQSTGFKRYYLHITLLNHSKWNQNNYNSFVVEYSAVSSTDNRPSKDYKRANESQIVCLVEYNSRIKVKFFYILGKSSQFDRVTPLNAHQYEKEEGKRALIKETEFELNFSELVDLLPMRDSFDYEFTFGWEKGLEDHIVPRRFSFTEEVKVCPKRRNAQPFTQQLQTPRLGIKLLSSQEEKHGFSDMIQKTIFEEDENYEQIQ